MRYYEVERDVAVVRGDVRDIWIGGYERPTHRQTITNRYDHKLKKTQWIGNRMG